MGFMFNAVWDQDQAQAQQGFRCGWGISNAGSKGLITLMKSKSAKSPTFSLRIVLIPFALALKARRQSWIQAPLSGSRLPASIQANTSLKDSSVSRIMRRVDDVAKARAILVACAVSMGRATWEVATA